MRSVRPLMLSAALSRHHPAKPTHRRTLVSSASALAGLSAGLTAAATAAAQSQTDLERSALITGGDDISDILIADFDDNPDPELAVLDSGDDQVRIYDLQDGFTTATLLFTLDVTDGAAALLGLRTWYELASVEQGNLADDLLVGGGTGSTVYYDDTAL